MPLRCLLVDFNSYFASVEQQERPELRGLPVAVAPVLAETTCCIAISIEAKRLGLKGTLPVGEARKACPGLVVVEARPAVYIEYHHRLLAAIESCLHIDEVLSIDEVLCGLDSRFSVRETAAATALQIKKAVARVAGPCLRCSIGIAPNWLLAKAASDMQKPDGLVIIDDADIPGKLLHLNIGDICGIGPNMQRRLRASGLDTMAKLYAAPKERLRAVWGGVGGEVMHALLRGEPLERPPVERRSIGHSHVLPPELRSGEAARAVLHKLLQKAAMRLRATGHLAGALHAAMRLRGGPRWEDELRFNPTRDTLQLTHALNTLWERRPADIRRLTPIKVGVVLDALVESSAWTPDLFEREQEEARTRLWQAVDGINRALGSGSVRLAGAIGAEQSAPMRISFTRIPEPEVEEIDPSLHGRLPGKAV